jgi:hypothetical protein
MSSRVRHRVFRAFMASAENSTGDLVRWCWPRRQRFEPWMYYPLSDRCAPDRRACAARRDQGPALAVAAERPHRLICQRNPPITVTPNRHRGGPNG